MADVIVNKTCIGGTIHQTVRNIDCTTIPATIGDEVESDTGISCGCSGSGSSGSSGDSGSGSGSSSGPDLIQVDCCPNSIPSILYLTVTSVTGSCPSCLVGSYELVWNGTYWVNNSTACSPALEWRLECLGGTWYLFEDNVTMAGASFDSCSPFSMGETYNTPGGPSGCSMGDTVTYIITE